MNRTARYIFYSIVGISSFLFFLVVMFPLDTIISHYLANLESQTKGNYRISVSQMKPSLIFDSEFKDFSVSKKTDGTFQEVFYAPKIKVGFSFISLISSSINVNFAATLKDKGELSGGVLLSGKKSVYDLKFKKVSLANFPIIDSYLPVKVSGIVDGTLYLSLEEDIKQSESEFKIKLADFKTEKYAIKEANMELPALSLSSATEVGVIEGGLDQGFFTLSDFSMPGKDVNLQMKGRVQLLRNNVTRSNLNGKFKLSEGVEAEVPVFGFIAEQKTPDGFYPISVAGDLKKPRISIGTLKLSDMLNIKF